MAAKKSSLITAPIYDRVWLDQMIVDKHIAQVEVVETAGFGGSPTKCKWIGEPTDIVYIGYPFPIQDGATPGIGVPLIRIAEAPENHCAIFVRGDVYAEPEKPVEEAAEVTLVEDDEDDEDEGSEEPTVTVTKLTDEKPAR